MRNTGVAEAKQQHLYRVAEAKQQHFFFFFFFKMRVILTREGIVHLGIIYIYLKNILFFICVMPCCSMWDLRCSGFSRLLCAGFLSLWHAGSRREQAQ